jgi:Ran GTPase-activating protein (RanGAP) involved in mRNA processing and transport
LANGEAHSAQPLEESYRDGGVSQLLKVLCTNDTVVELNLSQIGLEPVMTDDLRAFLQSTTVLRDFDLSRNDLGDRIAAAFGEVFPSQDTIVNLWLATCHITDEGALLIECALVSNTTMKSISLRDEFLSQQVGFALPEILKTNEALWAIDLTST